MLRACVFSVALSVIASAAYAAILTAPPSSVDYASGGLEEITVTAQRRSENLQNVPIAVTAITGQRLTAAVIQDTQDLAAVTPGLTFPSDFQYALPHIRGVGNTTVAPGAENSVALYVDGVYYAAATGSILTLNNISQIEVLKGPQGTLFGRNATGGLIQIITKDPSQTAGLEANLTYGNYNTSSADLYLTGGVTNDLAVDLAVKATHQENGWGTNFYNGKDVYKLDRDISARSKALWTPIDGTSVLLSLDYESTLDSLGLSAAPGTTSPFYPSSVIIQNPYNVNLNVQPDINHKGGGASLNIRQDVSFADLVNIVAYRRSADYFTVDFDTGPSQIISDLTTQADEQISEELQLRSHETSPLQWTGGLFYFHAKSSFEPLNIGLGGPASVPIGPGLVLTNTVTTATQTSESIAAYAQATYAVTSIDNLTVGARYTHEKRSFDASQQGIVNDSFDVPLITGLRPSFTVNKPTWRVSLDHRFADDVMSYISYNRGFKSGGYNPGDPASPAYQTEQLNAYEVGLKAQMLERRLRVNTAVFYYDYKNIQVSRFVNGTPDVYNGAAAKIFGGDLDADASLSEHFTLNAGFEALHDKFTSFPCADFFAGGPNVSSPACSSSVLPTLPYLRSAEGNRLPDSPRFTSSVTFDYHTTVYGGRGDLSITDAFNNGFFYEPNNGESVHQSSYNLMNATTGWATSNEHFLVRLWVKNLTDKRYTSELASSSTGYAVAYAAPRTYGVTVGTKF